MPIGSTIGGRTAGLVVVSNSVMTLVGSPRTITGRSHVVAGRVLPAVIWLAPVS